MPLGDREQFLPKIKKIINKHSIKVIVSVVDEELQNILSLKKQNLIYYNQIYFLQK